VMVFSRMAETRVLKQLTDGDRTTSDGKLFHNVTVAGKKLNRSASTRTVGTKNLVLLPRVSRVFHVSLGAAVMQLNHELFGTAWWLWSEVCVLPRSPNSQPKYCNTDDGLPLTMVCVVKLLLPAAG